MYSKIVMGTVEQGLMYAIMVLGVYLTFRILDYADLTVEGSFTLGGATAAILIVNGTNPWLATAIAFGAGCFAGLFTGFLHTRLKISPLLTGILTMTALYSINLRVMGRANVSLLKEGTIFSDFKNLPGMQSNGVLILALLTILVMGVFLYLFLKTELGLVMRATGDNELMIRSLGVNTNGMKLLGLALSNGLVALSGSFIAQNQQFADSGMGIGMIVAGLASLIIGEVLIGTSTLGRALIAVICGGVIYRLIIAIALQAGLNPIDLKMITAFIVIFALAAPNLKFKVSALTRAGHGKETNYANGK